MSEWRAHVQAAGRQKRKTTWRGQKNTKQYYLMESIHQQKFEFAFLCLIRDNVQGLLPTFLLIPFSLKILSVLLSCYVMRKIIDRIINTPVMFKHIINGSVP